MAGLVVMILSLPLNGYVATKLKHYQVQQMKRKDERVKLMNETLSGIKVIRRFPITCFVPRVTFLCH